MYRSVSIPITPVRALDGSIILDTQGATVAVYSDLPGSRTALSASGAVLSGAVLTHVYSDRFATTEVANPIALDVRGRPVGAPDWPRTSSDPTYLTFYVWDEVVHLLLTAASGAKAVLLTVPSHPLGPLNSYTYTLDTALDAVRSVNSPGSIVLNRPGATWAMTANASLKCLEYGEKSAGGLMDASIRAWYDITPITVRCIHGVDHPTSSATGPLCGIQLGQFTSFPFDAASANPVVQLRLNAKTGNGTFGKYELVSSTGGGAVATKIITSNVQPVPIDSGNSQGMYDRLELYIDVTNRIVRGFVNGEMIAETRDTIPEWQNWDNSGLGISYFYCATNALDAWNGWFFALGRDMLYNKLIAS